MLAVCKGGVLNAVRSGIATRCQRAPGGQFLRPSVGMKVSGYVDKPVRLSAVIVRSPFYFADTF